MSQSLIVDFLAAIQPEPHDTEQIEARYITAGQKPVRRFYATRTALAAEAVRVARTSNAYMGVALRSGGGDAAHCTRTAVLWADIDAKLFGQANDALATALAVVNACALTASVVVGSGGGFHVYWKLAEPVDLHAAGMRKRVELLNAALARAVVGPDRTPDHVQDVGRILRLPGTLNHKSAPPKLVTVAWLRPERVYTLDAIESFLRERCMWALRSPTPAVARQVQWTSCQEMPDDLRERAARGRIKRTTLNLLDSTGPAGYSTPSEADAAIAAGLISAGLTAVEALALLGASARGKNALERKGERQAEAYWKRTIEHAASFVGPVVETSRGRVRLVHRPVTRPYREVTRPLTQSFTLVGGPRP